MIFIKFQSMRERYCLKGIWRKYIHGRRKN